MEYTRLKKPLLFLISGIAVGTLTVLACAGGDWGPSEGSMFTPELIGNEKYTPFFRDPSTRLYMGQDPDELQPGLKVFNTAEWVSFFEEKVKPEDVDYWLYTASLNQIDSMIFAVKGKPANLTALSKAHSLLTVPQSGKATGFLFYVGFARRNEAFTVVEQKSWYDDEKPKKVDAGALQKQIAGGLKFIESSKDPFLTERYLFQVERLYYFNGQYNEAIATYDKNESAWGRSNTIRWRALGYKAGALYKQKNYSEANYIYAGIYDGFEPGRLSAYYSFHPQNESDWAKTLALAKNDHQKEVLWHLFGIYNDPLRAMKEIVKINPKSELLDLLLVRAVNTEEENFNPVFEFYDKQASMPFNDKINGALVSFVNETAKQGNTADPALWSIAGAYLSYAKRDIANGDAQLKDAEKRAGKDALSQAQLNLTRLFGKLVRAKALDEATENAMLDDIKALFDPATDKLTTFRSSFGRSWTRITLASLYAHQQQYEKAELIQPGTVNGYFKTNEHVQKMIAYWENPQKTALEKFFMQNASLHKDDYKELLAIRYAQKGQLTDALSALNGTTNGNKELYGNPFNIHIKDCHDCDHEAPQKVKYTSLSFIRKMIEMQNTAETKPAEAAQNYLLLANGYYNMTYYGNARHFYENDVQLELDDELDCSLALKYYLLAYDKSTDKEFKAKCLFMAAKCEQNAFFNNKPANYPGDFKSGVYFKRIRNECSDTKYYNEIIKECGYFKTYISAK